MDLLSICMKLKELSNVFMYERKRRKNKTLRKPHSSMVMNELKLHFVGLCLHAMAELAHVGKTPENYYLNYMITHVLIFVASHEFFRKTLYHKVFWLRITKPHVNSIKLSTTSNTKGNYYYFFLNFQKQNKKKLSRGDVQL